MINYYSYSNAQYLCQGNTVTNLSTLNFMNNHTSSLKLIELTTSFGWGFVNGDKGFNKGTVLISFA